VGICAPDIPGEPAKIPNAERAGIVVFCDFETRNIGGCDLTKAGAWRYAADPATQVLCFGYRTEGEDHLWTPEMGLCPTLAALAALAADPATRFVSFAGFEPAIWQRIMVERYGFAPIPVERWTDIQASCSYFALPRSLDKALTVIGAPTVKDTAGARLVRSLSRPDRRTGAYPTITPEVLERVGSYNRIDVAGTIDLYRALGQLPESERRVWELDQEINRRGLGIDIEFVRAAKEIAESSAGALLAEFAELTDGLTPFRVARTREWLKGQGFPLPDLQEQTVAEALEQILPDDVRRVLQIRSVTASTSLKKFDSMLACVSDDGRARGLLQYHAATPGRWSGALLQPQNLPRPTFEIDDPEALVAAVKTGEADALRPWGEPLEVLAGALRLAIVTQHGALFGVGDYSMIEACVLLALAGERGKCDLIAGGTDIYRDTAMQIFRLDRGFLTIPEEELSLEQTEHRRIGKNTVLGCGYQMGPLRFLRQYLRHLPADDAKALAERVIYTYRKKCAPRVPMLWRDLEQAARRAMLCPDVTAIARCGIGYRLETKAGLPVLVCRLLNGKDIHYINARLSGKPDLWDRPKWTYWAYRRGQWREVEPYGGQLTENVCQALARELLVSAMFRCEERGFPIVLTVHDEIVVEHPRITEAIVEEIMDQRPCWAAELGVPITAKAWIGKRYRK
jgi:DNA polymerase bacteriophage-type